jgi:hypothetical protein
MRKIVIIKAILFIGFCSLITPLKSSVIESIPKEVPFSYIAFNFNANEGWNLRNEGDKGKSTLNGKIWSLDFTKGAKSISISPTRISFLGTVEKIHLKVRGTAKGHLVHVYIETHFMTFHKVVGKLSGADEQELIFAAPPGNDWLWQDGENDGKIHGPLRLMEIRIEGNNIKDDCQLELISISIDGKVAENKLCVLTSECSATDKPVTFMAKVRSISDKPLKGTLNWSIYNWDKKELEKGNKAVTIMPGGKGTMFEIKTNIKNPTLKFVEAVFHLDIPGQEIPDADACWLAPNEEQTDTSLILQTSFGMGVYLCRYHGKELEKLAQKAKECGVKWVREDFSIFILQPEKGKYNWSYSDSIVEIAKKNGISVLGILGDLPPWSKEYSKEGIDEFIIFLKELVKHYKNDIHQWEIWNEPNIFFWQGPKKMYAELLMKSYIAIKDIDSTIQVLGISTAGIDYEFIQKMLALQAPFDVLTVHPYRKRLNENEFINELEKASDLVALPGAKHRPVWITEMGWTTFTPHNSWVEGFFPSTTLRDQAELITRSYLSCIISGVDPKVFWYNMLNDGTDPHNMEDNLGIMNKDFSPKPAYIAYSTMTRTLKGMKYVSRIQMPEGVFAAQFADEKDKNNKVIAIWCPAEDKNVEIETNSNKAILINTLGEISDLAVHTKDMKNIVQVQLKKGSPVYIK